MRHDDPRDTANPRDASQHPTPSACFFAGSFLSGVLAVILLTAGLSVSTLHVSAPVLIHQVSGGNVGRGVCFVR